MRKVNTVHGILVAPGKVCPGSLTIQHITDLAEIQSSRLFIQRLNPGLREFLRLYWHPFLTKA